MDLPILQCKRKERRCHQDRTAEAAPRANLCKGNSRPALRRLDTEVLERRGGSTSDEELRTKAGPWYCRLFKQWPERWRNKVGWREQLNDQHPHPPRQPIAIICMTSQLTCYPWDKEVDGFEHNSEMTEFTWIFFLQAKVWLRVRNCMKLWWLSWQRICLPWGRAGLDPWVGKMPWRREPQ